MLWSWVLKACETPEAELREPKPALEAKLLTCLHPWDKMSPKIGVIFLLYSASIQGITPETLNLKS